jgi:hypothetical protein
MPAYILTQITASFWIRAIDAAGFWSRKIVGSEPAQARIQCCNHQEFQNVFFCRPLTYFDKERNIDQFMFSRN